MLILQVKTNQVIKSDGPLTICFVEVRGPGKIRIGLEADDEVAIWREMKDPDPFYAKRMFKE